MAEAGQRDRVAFEGIVEDPHTFEFFLNTERDLLIKGGVPEPVVETILGRCYHGLDRIRSP